MLRSSPAFRRLLGVLGFVLLWSLIGFAFAGQFYLSSSLLGRSITWSQAISYSLADWYVWAVLSIPISRLARRYPPTPEAPWRTAGIHLIYGVIISVSHALDYYRKYHERTIQTLELEKHLTEARLQSLLRQLKPHFLFNALNGIASLMYSDLPAAERMLVRLAELLRQTMSQTGAPLTALKSEIAFLDCYLGIERIRFRDRLVVNMEIAPDTMDAQVPSLILQPLVENAIRHGIEPQMRAGQITLKSSRVGDDLILTVTDNGGGIPAGGFKREGIGLANTRARLSELYGSRQQFELANQSEGGLCVRLSFPFTTQS